MKPNGLKYDIQDGVLRRMWGSTDHVEIRPGVTKIGQGAFGSASFQSITLPEGVKEIGRDAFADNYCLKSVTLPESLRTIGDEAFKGCIALKSIKIPEGVTDMGWMTFFGCSSLSTINLPEGITELGRNIFSGCTSLSLSDIPKGVTKIWDGAFKNCKKIMQFDLPACLTEIPHELFSGCFSLRSLTLPESVTTIGEKAFCGCESLQEIIILNSKVEIAKNAFEGCGSLKKVTLNRRADDIPNECFLPYNKYQLLWRGFLAHPELYDAGIAASYWEYIACYAEHFDEPFKKLSVPYLKPIIEAAHPDKDTLRLWTELAIESGNTELVAYLMEVIHNTDGEDDPFKALTL